MARIRYEWKRYWCPRSGEINLDGGYLADPGSGYGFALNPDLKTFEQLAETPVLILLGEPGIGKSTAMADAYSATGSVLKRSHDQCLWFDLATFQTDLLLVERVFKGVEFANWRDGTHRLHLFLDSLDECRLRIESVANLLLNELRGCPTDRLSLRIACRSADWPMHLEEGLKELWSVDECAAVALAPLTRNDAEHAANANDVDGALFIEAVGKLGVDTFAARPVTLEFLLRSYARERALPSSQVDLYYMGCRLLCEEVSESRRAAGQMGQLEADARLVVASRLAAIMVFTNRLAIWRGIDRGDVPAGDVTVASLIGGSERAAGFDFDVREPVVREVLDTGLLTDAGPNRLAFVHRTYAEFLAARYVKDSNISLRQALSLVIASNDPERKIVPQLRETAAWMACQVPELFDELVLSDPVALVGSDVLVSDEEARSGLLRGLLESYDTGDQPDYWKLSDRYSRLCHKQLSPLLRPYIVDASHHLIAQRAAAEIAGKCKVNALQAELAQVALDTTRPLTVRKHAAVAVGEMGDEETRGKLKSLALEPLEDDPDDELKGAALRAVWPDLLTVEELFAALTWPKRTNLIGQYSVFLSYRLSRGLEPEELPTALTWACRTYDPLRNLGSIGHLIDSLVESALQHTGIPGILPPLGRIVLAKLEHHDPILPIRNFTGSAPQKELELPQRRDLLTAVVSVMTDPEKQCPRVVMARPRILLAEDVTWMLAQLDGAAEAIQRVAWSDLVRFALDYTDACQVDAVLIGCSEYPELASSFSDLLTPIDLDSAEASRRRKLNEDMKRLEAESSAVSNTVEKFPSIKERILPLLEKTEKGESDYYANIDFTLSIDVEGRLTVDTFGTDLTAFPGWGEIDSSLQDRVVDSADAYLRTNGPVMEGWPKTHTRGSLAGARALTLLQKVDRERLDLLSDESWARWLPALLGHPTIGLGDSEHLDFLGVLSLAYERVPIEFVSTTEHHILAEARSGSRITTTEKLNHCWDARLANALLAMVRDAGLEPDSVGEILECLAAHQVAEAIAFAIASVEDDLAKSKLRDRHARVCARVLLTHSPNHVWPLLRTILSGEPDVAKEVMRAAVVREGGLDKLLSQLGEDHLADLFIWLASHYTHATDPQTAGVRSVGPDEQLRDFRDATLNTIKSRGTQEACVAIERVRKELPHLDWLRWSLAETRETMRSRTWVPPTPEEVVSLAIHRNARLVRDPEELLDTVRDSLLRLESHFRGETPITFSLWDKVGVSSYRPKPEEAFTDFVKWHLEKDLGGRGIVLNREVQIRRGAGQRRGQRTDIHIDAVTRDTRGNVYDKLTVIVEAKGSWHKELYTAMSTQLVGRYLSENPCKHGLYLVGWFDGSLTDGKPDGAWTPGDSIEVARARLNSQARDLSDNGVHVESLVIDVSLTDPGPMEDPGAQIVRRHGK